MNSTELTPGLREGTGWARMRQGARCQIISKGSGPFYDILIAILATNANKG